MKEYRVVLEVSEQEVFYIDAESEEEAQELAKDEAADIGFEVIAVTSVQTSDAYNDQFAEEDD